MGALNLLFAFLSLIFFVLIVVGLINPKWVKMQSRMKAFLIFFVGMIISSIIFNATMSDEAKAKQKAEIEAAAQNDREEKLAAQQEKAEPEQRIVEAAPVEVKAEKEEVSTAVELTGPQRNAVRSAEQYISFSGFSRDGLINQLSSSYGDNYDKKDATVAVDSLNIDWNEQAVKSAKQYLDMSGFSCQGLIDQLSSDAGDKYTRSQAAYGAKQAGACS